MYVQVVDRNRQEMGLDAGVLKERLANPQLKADHVHVL